MILQDVYQIISNLDYEIEQGHLNPLKGYAECKLLADLCASIMDKHKASAIAERMKYGKEEVLINDYVIDHVPGRKMLSYKHNETWQELNRKLKEHEQLMAMAASNVPVANTETGEMIEPAQVSYSAESLRFTFKKPETLNYRRPEEIKWISN